MKFKINIGIHWYSILKYTTTTTW